MKGKKQKTRFFSVSKRHGRDSCERKTVTLAKEKKKKTRFFPDEQLAAINVSNSTPWYADYANYIVAKYIPPRFTYQQKKKILYDLRHYFWDDPHLNK